MPFHYARGVSLQPAPPSQLLQAYAKGKSREAPVLLQCRRQRSSTVLANGITLQQMRQVPRLS